MPSFREFQFLDVFNIHSYQSLRESKRLYGFIQPAKVLLGCFLQRSNDMTGSQ